MMNMIWVCPACRGILTTTADSVRCQSCNADYPRVGNIPDLRLPGDSWLDHDEDLENARSLYSLSETQSLEELVRTVFARRPGWDESRIELRTRQVLEAPKKYQVDVCGWLAKGLNQADTFLDLGCGGGMLIAAAAPHTGTTLGIDVSIEWLVVAERLITEHGGRPCLAAAMAEHMPLPPASVGFVVSLDVIEHVRDPARYLTEIVF